MIRYDIGVQLKIILINLNKGKFPENFELTQVVNGYEYLGIIIVCKEGNWVVENDEINDEIKDISITFPWDDTDCHLIDEMLKEI